MFCTIIPTLTPSLLNILIQVVMATVNGSAKPIICKVAMDVHDMTDGWNTSPNCYIEGKSFFGIPQSRK